LALLIDQLVQTDLVPQLSPDLECELKELENQRKSLRKQGGKLDKEKEKRREELGKLLREGYILINEPFQIHLDWWQEDDENIPKTWAGSQEVFRIAQAALASLGTAPKNESLFDYACVMVCNLSRSQNRDNKVEPFYFDARRGSNALSLDIGFMPDALNMRTVAYPAVEFFCLVGLQRFRPTPTDAKRVFDYYTWNCPLPTSVAPLAASGVLPYVGAQGYRFRVAFRTDQKKHKAFTPGVPFERTVI
jgi:CRISPR-associated protein Csb3